LFWMLLFALLPLVVVDSHQLAVLYRSWLHLLVNDRSASTGLSVMGILVSWWHLDAAKNIVTGAGIVLFLLPLVYVRYYRDLHFRLLYLANMLIWMVIFNHKAESPTFVIVMAGIGIWYFSQQPDKLDKVLVILSFLLITMSVSDLVPAAIRNGFIRPYGIKAVMAIVIWCRILYEQMTFRERTVGSSVKS